LIGYGSSLAFVRTERGREAIEATGYLVNLEGVKPDQEERIQ
jgi:hypothetical protein